MEPKLNLYFLLLYPICIGICIFLLNCDITIGVKIIPIFNHTNLNSYTTPRTINGLQEQFRCPIHRGYRRNFKILSEENNNSPIRIIKLNEMNGQKVKVEFFYPNQQNIIFKSVIMKNSDEELSNEITTTMGGIENIIGNSSEELETTTETLVLERNRVTKKNDGMNEFDIMCQWKFQGENSTQYLLLTFNKMSAPYSKDCQDAYVSMQKADGYESRWCGNRRQGKGRPLALFSHSSATITVFKGKSAPESPPTGFSVTVESLENKAVNNVKGSFRILLQKIQN